MSDTIGSTTELAELCDAAADVGWAAIDTEFLRERTYYPRLCLVQISYGNTIRCVDPLQVPDLAPLCTLVCGVDTLKIMHAARQDLEVLYQHCGCVARTLFDTQIAAAMLGYGDQVGYATLVERVVGERLPKHQTRTDWCARPLTEEQMQYAFDDVRYLGPLFERLDEELRRRGRSDWHRQECERLSDIELYRVDPEQAFKRFRGGHTLDAPGQQLLKAMIRWREQRAQAVDLPRNWVATDALLMALASARPGDLSQLGRVSGATPRFIRRFGDEVCQLVRDHAGVTEGTAVWRPQPRLTGEQTALSRRLMDLIRQTGQQHDIAPGLLGTRQDVERLVRGSTDVALLQGWRRELVGERLLRAMAC